MDRIIPEVILRPVEVVLLFTCVFVSVCSCLSVCGRVNSLSRVWWSEPRIATFILGHRTVVFSGRDLAEWFWLLTATRGD